ncbi:MAG: response regulator [Deltaproteobacteria bacterium]|nr:MAG: response regulator [Deltaproteobacteria bacterium]
MTVRALLVEDDVDIRAVGEVALAAVGGWTVTTAESGFRALELAPRVLPDVILMDMMMPGMDGVTCFKKLREIPELSAIPIVFLTAKVQRNEVEDYKALGAAGVIHKPFDPMTLAEEVLTLIR